MYPKTKGWKNIYNATTKQKRAGMNSLTSCKTVIKTRSINRN